MDTMTQTLANVRQKAGCIKVPKKPKPAVKVTAEVTEKLTPQQKAARTRAKNKEKDK